MDTTFAKTFLSLCLAQSLPQMVAKSYRHYHVRGFNSIILSASPELTLRLYMCLPGETELRPENDRILVHNHGFDFQTQVLVGHMENVVYAVKPAPSAAPPWYQYRYDSALKNEAHQMRLTPMGPVPLTEVQRQRVEAGQSYFLQHQELHRIFVPADRLVAMLFWQHARVEQDPWLFSPVPLPEIFPTEGLYERLEQEDLRALVQLVIDAL